MTETPATYDTETKPCACGCPNRIPANSRRRYYNGACRARMSRMRRQLGAEPGQVKRCQIMKHGEVSLTLRLPHTWQHRMHELVPGAWVDVVPHRSES